MSFDVADALRTAQLVRELMEAQYTGAAGRVIQEIAGNSTSGIMRRRLRELNDEAARLAGLGERLDPQNPVLRAVVADFNNAMLANGRAVAGAADDIQRIAVDEAGQLVRQLALPGLDDRALAQIGVGWNVPDPEAVNALVGFVDDPAWAAQLAQYSDDGAAIINNIAVRGFVEGWGPQRMAREIVSTVESVPISQADNLMRTLQIQASERAAVAHRLANADILESHIRIAALDDRTCLACIALHGTELKLNEQVVDHHRGRCTSISIVTGRGREMQSGEEWFEALPEERQRSIAGHANFEAIQAGVVRLRDFPQRYDDPVFGEMVREASLSSRLGEGAREYYRHG